MDVVDRIAALWLPWLLWTSLQTLLLATLVALLNRCLPRLSAGTRCLLWWLVGLQVLAGIGWRIGLHGPPAVDLLLRVAAVPSGAPPEGWATAALPVHVLAEATRGLHASRWAFLAWLLLVAMQVLHALRQASQASSLRRQSLPLDSELLQTLVDIQARTMGLRRKPELRIAPTLHSPVVSGLWRPVILLPGTDPLAPDEIAMVLAHEMAHLKRADLWLGWIPAVAVQLLCFHPVLLWSQRQYRLQRETACDELAMRHSREDPRAYGRLLVRFGCARPSASQLGGGATARNDLNRRLQALQRAPLRRSGPRLQTRMALLLALLGTLPYEWSVAGGQVPVIVAPPAPPPLAPVAPLPAAPPPPMPAVQPSAVPPPTIAAPPPPAISTGSAVAAAAGTSAWAAFDGKTLYFQGSASDQARFVKYRQDARPVLWYRRGHQVYVSHDRQLVRQAMLAMQASPDGGYSQLGARQALLQQQWRVAAEQGDLAERQAELAARQAQVHRLWINQLWRTRLSRLPWSASSIPRPALAPPEQSDLAAMDAMRKQQQVLQQRMEALVQQQVLARPTATSSRRAAPLQKLLDEAVRQGRASPVGQ